MAFENIVIDSNNLFWRCSATSVEKALELNTTKIYSDTIKNFVTRSLELVKRFGREDSKIYFLFDNPKSAINVRKLISKGKYKHSRATRNVPENFYKSLKILKEVLKSYSNTFHVVYADHLEADDLTLPIKKYIQPRFDNKILYVSNDLDWSRNLDEFCLWYDWKNVYNPEEFFKKYTFWPKGNAVQMYKTFRGDNSDNISVPIRAFPEETLLHIIETYTDIEDLFKRARSDQKIPKQWLDKIFDNYDQLRENYSLVDFIELDLPIEDLLYIGSRNPVFCRIWFRVLRIPLETWMMSKADRNSINFFKTNTTIK